MIGSNNSFQTFVRVGGHLSGVWRKQVGVSLMVRSTHAAAQLMQLREPKLVGTVNNNGVGAGNVDASLNNGRTNQYVGALVIKI